MELNGPNMHCIKSVSHQPWGHLKVSAMYRGLCLRNYVIGETGINSLVSGIYGSSHDGTPLILSISLKSWDVIIPTRCLNHRY